MKQELENITKQKYKKKEEEKAIKIFLFKIIVEFFKDTLSFNTLNQKKLIISLNFILKTSIIFQDN